MKHWLLLVALPFFLEAQSLEITPNQVVLSHEVSSGSGMTHFQERLFVVGDDSPFLFEIDPQFSVINSWLIAPYDTLIDNRLPKKTKPDYEALEVMGDSALLVLSSGSKSPTRDLAVYVDFKNEQPQFTTFSITPLYNMFRALPEMKGAALNIEGLTVLGANLLLFNRTNNVVFQIPSATFFAYLFDQGELPTAKVVSYQLPTLKGLNAGFSGATTSSDGQWIWFTASVEASKNTYDDGKVLGSFIGVIQQVDGELAPNIFAIKKVEVARNKIESVTITTNEDIDKTFFYFVSDNDDGTSVFERMEVLLHY